jgi:hypothetical protein
MEEAQMPCSHQLMTGLRKHGYIHNGALFSHKVESNCDICRKMDGTGVCHVK